MARRRRKRPAKKKPAKRRIKAPSTKKPSRKKPKRGPKLTELSKDWQQYFSELMSSSCASLDELGCHYRTHINPDGSVHADMTVEGFGRGNARRVLLDIEHAGDWAKTGDAVWITIGTNVDVISRKRGAKRGDSPPIDRGVYRRWTYPQRTRNAAENFVTARELTSSIEGITAANLSIRGLIVRLHWNPADAQPERPRTKVKHG